MSFQSDSVENVSEDGLESDPRWELVQRVIKSRHFAKSARLQNFLVYVCRCKLTGQTEEINEQRIGARVFQRSTHYNPTEDNIVRSQARLLRQRLQSYFDSEGQSEPLLLVIPKGGYTPEFVDRPTAPIETPASPPTRAERRASLVRWLSIAIAALAVVVVFQSSLLFKRKSEHAGVKPQTPLPSSVNALWSQLFSEGLPTTVIVPDATVGKLQAVTSPPVHLATYLRRSPVTDNQKVKDIEAILRGFSIRRYTTFDSVSTAVRVTELAHQFNAHSTVRYARDMTLGEFSPGNVVLIGRPATNPWSAMFEPKLNFWFYSDLKTDTAICMNRSPEPGEESQYPPINEGAKRTVYAAVSFMPNLKGAGNVLIIAGTSSGAQAVAAEFLTTEKLLSRFRSKLPRSEEGIPFFEILIRTVTLAGVAQEPEVIAYRVREPQ